MQIATRMLILALIMLVSGPALAQECPEVDWATGEWRGEVQGAGMIVVFRFQSEADNCLTGSFDMPAYNARQLPFSQVKFDADRQVLHAHSEAMNFRYQGQYQGEGELEGQFIQKGTENATAYALILERMGDE